MKLQSLATFAAIAVAAVSSPVVRAAECTEEQLGTTNAAEDPTFMTACPALFADGEDTLDYMDLGSIDESTLAALGSCKETACITALTKLVEQTPDCEIVGINVKAAYGSTLKLCQKLGEGAVTGGQVADIFKDVITNVTNTVNDVLDNSSAVGSAPGDGSLVVDTPVAATVGPTSGSTKEEPGISSGSTAGVATSVPASTSAVPTATPKPASGASASTVASAVVFATTAMVALLE